MTTDTATCTCDGPMQCVYLLAHPNGLTKIGFSRWHPRARARRFSYLLGVECELLGYITTPKGRQLEMQIHHTLEPFHRGREFFALNREVVRFLLGVGHVCVASDAPLDELWEATGEPPREPLVTMRELIPRQLYRELRAAYARVCLAQMDETGYCTLRFRAFVSEVFMAGFPVVREQLLSRLAKE